MIIGLLICTIGLIPIVLALNVNKIYSGSKLSLGLFLYMISITIWQIDVGILYFKDLLNERNALFLFRLFRIGPTFAIPIVFYVSYEIIENYSTIFKNNNFINKILKYFITKKILFILFLWSCFIYIINWTKLGIEELNLSYINDFTFYFPKYGLMSWVYLLHMSTFILFLVCVFLIALKLHNTYMKNFLKGFSMYSFLLLITGFLNFYPKTGILTSSIGVIIFSTMIMIEFVKLNTNMMINYYQLIERQKKLDFTGNLAGSLIHEVKNTNIIIKGFSKMLHKDSSNLNERQKSAIDMILQATEQVEDLANNYKEYMKNSKMDFKMEDIVQIIEQSMQFSKEIINENHVNVEFINDFKSLKALVNKTYLQQVFINLIKNSTEAISKDKEDRKITIKTELMDDMITIHFYDTGKGIPLENWESIFDPFISFKDKGMGLGLAFVKKILFEHRGDIVVADSTPAGTHFKITIPQFGIHYIH